MTTVIIFTAGCVVGATALGLLFYGSLKLHGENLVEQDKRERRLKWREAQCDAHDFTRATGVPLRVLHPDYIAEASTFRAPAKETP